MRKSILNALLLICVSGCATPPSLDYFNNRDCNFYGVSFCTAAIGQGVYISNGPDFLVYNFHYNDEMVLALYEGNHPQRIGLNEYADKQLGDVVIKYREYDDGSTVHRYFLNDNIDAPTFLHAMSPKEMTISQQKFVEYVLSTLKYCFPSGASMICE